jgi:hypothetical protein
VIGGIEHGAEIVSFLCYREQADALSFEFGLVYLGFTHDDCFKPLGYGDSAVIHVITHSILHPEGSSTSRTLWRLDCH